MAAVAHAQRKASVHEVREVRRQHLDADRGQPAFFQGEFRVDDGPERGMPELREDREGAYARGFLRARMHQDGHAFARDERGEERHQVGELSRSIVAGQQHGQGPTGGQPQGAHVRGERIHHPGEFLEAFSLDPQRDEHRPEGSARQLAGEDGSEKRPGLLAGKVASAVAATGQVFQEGTGVEGHFRKGWWLLPLFSARGMRKNPQNGGCPRAILHP